MLDLAFSIYIQCMITFIPNPHTVKYLTPTQCHLIYSTFHQVCYQATSEKELGCLMYPVECAKRLKVKPWCDEE